MTVTATTSTIDVRPTTGLIGAEVHGVDLRGPRDQVEMGEIRDALHRHGVLFFPGQQMSPAHHVEFARDMGDIVMPHAKLQNLSAEDLPEISVIASDSGYAVTADVWHSDVTWRPEPSRYSILHMQVVPPAGGDTMWSSQFHAFESLSAPVQEMLRGLTAHHTAPSGIGSSDHPVVVRHPNTGRRALFVNGLFTTRINELTQAESDALLPHLIENATRPEYTCRRRWTVGDVAIWDNHFVQHYAINDYGSASRKIHRIEVQPEQPVAGDWPEASGERGR